MYDAVLNFRDAYSEYVSNYPIAARRIDDELANNQRFKYFAEVSSPPRYGSDVWGCLIFCHGCL